MTPILDSDGIEVKAGDLIRFAYDQPPVGVAASVIDRNGKLIAITPGHRPRECPVDALERYVHDFWVDRTASAPIGETSE